jgi:hypothetical protein
MCINVIIVTMIGYIEKYLSKLITMVIALMHVMKWGDEVTAGQFPVHAEFGPAFPIRLDRTRISHAQMLLSLTSPKTIQTLYLNVRAPHSSNFVISYGFCKAMQYCLCGHLSPSSSVSKRCEPSVYALTLPYTILLVQVTAPGMMNSVCL